jgi:hypothetical protein
MSPIKKRTIPARLIAPCGMNCRLCRAYGREKNPCPSCRGDDRLKSSSCVACTIKNCRKLKSEKHRYCFTCESFPCAALNHLDVRYRTTYAMSMIDNLKSIQEIGIRQFTRNEVKKWACPECGTILCVHKEDCIHCGHTWRKQKSPRLRTVRPHRITL